MKIKCLLLLICMFVSSNFVFSQYVDREKGYYVDERNQFAEYYKIPPPHPEKIPKPKPTKTVLPSDSYYDINVLGIRRPPYKEPIVPGYNKHYSTRRAMPYSRSDFLDVWCDGSIDYGKGTCTSENYVMYYYPVRDWAVAVTTIPFRTHKIKRMGKKIAFFFWVDNLGLDAEATSDVKYWHTSFNLPVVLATIDSLIPLNWVP